MLELSRKKNEIVKIGENIFVRIIEVRGNVVRLGFEAPRAVVILRDDLPEEKEMSDEGCVGSVS